MYSILDTCRAVKLAKCPILSGDRTTDHNSRETSTVYEKLMAVRRCDLPTPRDTSEDTVNSNSAYVCNSACAPEVLANFFAGRAFCTPGSAWACRAGSPACTLGAKALDREYPACMAGHSCRPVHNRPTPDIINILDVSQCQWHKDGLTRPSLRFQSQIAIHTDTTN